MKETKQQRKAVREKLKFLRRAAKHITGGLGGNSRDRRKQLRTRRKQASVD